MTDAAKQPDTDNPLSQWLGFIIAGIAVVGLAVALGAALYFRNMFGHYLAHDSDQWARFGNYFSGVAGTVLGFLAVVAALLTLWVQNRELKAQMDNSRERKQEERISLTG